MVTCRAHNPKTEIALWWFESTSRNNQKDIFERYQRRTISNDRCRQMGIKFVLNVLLRKLRQCKSVSLNTFVVVDNLKNHLCELPEENYQQW